jgi:hypothetical protein
MLKTSNKRGGVGGGLTRIPTIIIEEGDENLDHNSSPNMVFLSSHVWTLSFHSKEAYISQWAKSRPNDKCGSNSPSMLIKLKYMNIINS